MARLTKPPNPLLFVPYLDAMNVYRSPSGACHIFSCPGACNCSHTFINVHKRSQTFIVYKLNLFHYTTAGPDAAPARALTPNGRTEGEGEGEDCFQRFLSEDEDAPNEEEEQGTDHKARAQVGHHNVVHTRYRCSPRHPSISATNTVTSSPPLRVKVLTVLTASSTTFRCLSLREGYAGEEAARQTERRRRNRAIRHGQRCGRRE
jgi:hypothetical protein